MAIERLFVAVSLPQSIVDVVSDLPTKPLRGVRYTRRAQWHLTLRFLGDCEVAEAYDALASLDGVAPDVTLGPKVSMLGDRIVVVPAAGLDDLAASVAEAFSTVGEPSEREFVGHLTLARLKGAPLRNPNVVSVLGADISASFTAATAELVKVDLDSDGATYTPIASRELALR